MRRLAFLLALLCAVPAVAGEGITSRLFVTVSGRYVTAEGGGLGMAYQFKSGVLVSAAATYDQIDGQSGSTRFRCWRVPYQTADYGHRGAEVTVAIPLRFRR